MEGVTKIQTKKDLTTENINGINPSDLQETSDLWPIDQYNKTLIAHARPPKWTNPTPERVYNPVMVLVQQEWLLLLAQQG